MSTLALRRRDKSKSPEKRRIERDKFQWTSFLALYYSTVLTPSNVVSESALYSPLAFLLLLTDFFQNPSLPAIVTIDRELKVKSRSVKVDLLLSRLAHRIELPNSIEQWKTMILAEQVNLEHHVHEIKKEGGSTPSTRAVLKGGHHQADIYVSNLEDMYPGARCHAIPAVVAKNAISLGSGDVVEFNSKRDPASAFKAMHLYVDDIAKSMSVSPQTQLRQGQFAQQLFTALKAGVDSDCESAGHFTGLKLTELKQITRGEQPNFVDCTTNPFNGVDPSSVKVEAFGTSCLYLSATNGEKQHYKLTLSCILSEEFKQTTHEGFLSQSEIVYQACFEIPHKLIFVSDESDPQPLRLYLELGRVKDGFKSLHEELTDLEQGDERILTLLESVVQQTQPIPHIAALRN